MPHLHPLERSARSLALFGALTLVVTGTMACSRPQRLQQTRENGAKVAAVTGKDQPPEPSAVALCRALHETPSRRRAECCSEAPLTLYLDECVRVLSAAVRTHRVRLDATKTAACSARNDVATRGCDWVAPTLPGAPRECTEAVTGLVEAGGRCTSSLECESDLHCAGQGATTPGTCKPPQPTGAGCGTSVDTLATYLTARHVERAKPPCAEHCNLSTHQCEEAPAVGAACVASVNCRAGQTCTKGHCELAAPIERAPGESCTTDLDCAAGGCVTTPDGDRTCAKKCSTDVSSLLQPPLRRLR